MAAITSQHFQELFRGISSLTVDPYKGVLYYFFPFTSAIFSQYQELRLEPTEEAMMPNRETQLFLREIEDLTNCADIRRNVTPYIALNHQFSSCGGPYSFTNPALFIPAQHLFRQSPLPPFTQEAPRENLDQNLWVFSDDETRFLIARELGQIKESNTLLKVAIKITLLAAVFVFFATQLGPFVSIGLILSSLLMYIASERFLRKRADFVGVEILGKKIQNPVQVAIQTLEKMRRQNIYRREHSNFAKWYITEDGNNLLDFIHPFLTTRIHGLKECEKS